MVDMSNVALQDSCVEFTIEHDDQGPRASSCVLVVRNEDGSYRPMWKHAISAMSKDIFISPSAGPHVSREPKEHFEPLHDPKYMAMVKQWTEHSHRSQCLEGLKPSLLDGGGGGVQSEVQAGSSSSSGGGFAEASSTQEELDKVSGDR